MLFKFVDASPVHGQAEKDRIKAEVSAHAARASHQKRRRAEDCKAGLHTNCRPVKAKEPSIKESISSSSVHARQHWSSPKSSQSKDRTSTRPTCGACGRRTNSDGGSDLYSHAEMVAECEYSSGLTHSAALHTALATRPGWSQEDVVDLQFFVEVFGSSVRFLSDSAFFNVVVPCLVDFDVGVRNLILAISSTYRKTLSLSGADQRAANVRALEKCNIGIKRLSTDFALAPSEVLLTSYILMAIRYMLRLDVNAAAVCMRAAESICHMQGRTRLKCRLLSARNATDPRPDSGYQTTVFADIVIATVAKMGLEFLRGLQGPTVTPVRTSVRLELSSEGLRFRIRDMHDLLSSIELLFPIFQRLRETISCHAHIDHNTRLARDLLVRLDQIGTKLRETPIQHGRIATAIEIIWQWHCYYSIGIRCQILSSSEMSWDRHLDEFRMLLECSEKCLSRMQEESSFVFLPVSIILRPLWFTAVHCRNPEVRSRAIRTLVKYHRNEAGLDSWFAGHIAQELMHLEEANRNIRCASSIGECDRIILRGFESEGEQLYLLYMFAIEVGMSTANTIYRRPFTIPRDRHGVVQSWVHDGDNINQLLMLAASVQQASPEEAPLGSSGPVYYDGQFVDVMLPKRGVPPSHTSFSILQASLEMSTLQF